MRRNSFNVKYTDENYVTFSNGTKFKIVNVRSP